VIAGLIVGVSVALTLAFLVAWASSSALRQRIELPKYRFLDAVRMYDRSRVASSEGPNVEER